MLINDVLLMLICGDKATHHVHYLFEKPSSFNHSIPHDKSKSQVTMSGSAPNDPAPGGHSRELQQTPLDSNQHGQAQ